MSFDSERFFKEDCKMNMDRHESEVAHHQNKINAQAEEVERIQEEREAIAAATDWKDVGEQAIKDFNQFQKSDFFNAPDWKLENIFDYLVMMTTDWSTHEAFAMMNLDLAIKEQLKELRDNQAALAEEHFMNTGEME